MALRLTLFALVTFALAGCVDRCPCGAKTSDPIELHDPAFTGSHELPTEASLDGG